MYSYCRDGEADHQDDEGDQEVGEAHLRLLYNILTLACVWCIHLVLNVMHGHLPAG